VTARRRVGALLSLLAVAGACLAVAKPYLWPNHHGARVERFDLDSRLTHKRLPVTVVVPAGAGDGRPLVVYLHGRSGTANSEMRNEAMFSELARLGQRAPVIAFPESTKASYWHDRRDGKWGLYVMRELIPAVEKRFHTDPRHVAIGGTSMGGYGAYDIARLNPGRFCAVGGHSPAIWQTGAESAAGAFDDAADFARHDLVAGARTQPGRWVGPRLWLDAGRGDPFQPGDRAFVSALKSHRVPISAHLSWRGAHEHSYWQRHWPAYLDFYARALDHCDGT
jgi:S-formylglutathione hydrolase FrmB